MQLHKAPVAMGSSQPKMMGLWQIQERALLCVSMGSQRLAAASGLEPFPGQDGFGAVGCGTGPSPAALPLSLAGSRALGPKSPSAARSHLPTSGSKKSQERGLDNPAWVKNQKKAPEGAQDPSLRHRPRGVLGSDPPGPAVVARCWR